MPNYYATQGTNLLILYGIGNCDTCNKARKWLNDEFHDYEFHDLRNDGLDIEMLEQWAARISWQKFFNTRSLTWRKIPEIDRTNITRNKAITLMIENPTLVKRPVLESNKFIEVGFSPNHYAKIFA